MRNLEERRVASFFFFACLSLCRASGKEAWSLYKHVYNETDVTNQSKKNTHTHHLPPPLLLLHPSSFYTEGAPELTTGRWACQASNMTLRRRVFFYLSIRGNLLQRLRGAGDNDLHRWWLSVFLLLSFSVPCWTLADRWLPKTKMGGGLRSKKKEVTQKQWDTGDE